jgi:2-dehydropantoate 2-reductase
VVLGAGAIGGVIAASLHRAGIEVAAIARGAHLAAIQRRGLLLRTPDGDWTVRLTAVGSPRELEWRDDDAVVLAVKSQDTEAALRDLAAVAPPSVVVACAQNGVANEPAALRLFASTLAVLVILPATHLEAGVVAAESLPCLGILDVGCYPAGVDAVAREVAVTLGAAGFSSLALPDVVRWKYRKLLVNLANAVGAICGPERARGELAARVFAEGEAVLRAAGIASVSVEEDAARRDGLISIRPIVGHRRAGSSSWQSLSRGTGSIEADYLNGEIVLLGRLHGVPTPANALVQRIANRMARERAGPGAISESEVLSHLDASSR